MDASRRNPYDVGPVTPPRATLRWIGVIVALAFPTVITWAYFVFAARYTTAAQQTTYLVVKSIQFAFPLIWVAVVLRESVRPRRPHGKGMFLGAAFSLSVVVAGWLLFHFLMRDMPAFTAAAAKIHAKITSFGIDTPWKYAILAAFYSLIHSLLEEYYWRWFVFRQLRGLVSLWPAILVSAMAFMAHHVVLLREFFSELPWLVWLLSSAVAIGGVFWAWLYERTGSLYSTWLSHLIIDAGIFWVGYDLVRHALTTST
jgi:membrane protease YdiL (CAAX protease family)